MLDIIRLAVVLTIVALIAGLAIAFTNAQTEDKIALQQQRAQQEALEAVLPEGTEIVEKEGQDGQPKQYWVAVNNGDIVAYALQGSNRGYSSSIRYIVGIRPDGEIVGVHILAQGETPGLGTRVTETVSKKYFWNGLWGPREEVDPWFTQQFIGLDATQ
ncbi:MAG: FMN-binding protein, partial [Chitinivibrionales bacterium]